MLAGGVAANLHGSVRATKDVDILVPKDVTNMRRLIGALSDLPYGIARELDAEKVVSKPLTIIGDDPRVDVMTVAWDLSFDEANMNRQVRRIRGVRIPYLGLSDLIRSKQTGRAQDAADLDTLRGTGPPRPRRGRSARRTRNR